MSNTGTTLSATTRTGRGKGPARQIRMAGGVPCEVYGLDEANQSVTVDAHDLNLVLAKGSNTLITLTVDDGAAQLTLARQVNRHPVKGTLTHVDFVRVHADQAIAAEVPLTLVGDSVGVAAGGLLEQQVFTVNVSAKPNAIPSSIEHDITALDLNDQVRVGDLVAPAGVELLDDPDTLIALVSVTRALAAAQREAAAEAEAAADAETGGDADADDAGDAE